MKVGGLVRVREIQTVWRSDLASKASVMNEVSRLDDFTKLG